jgi:hypothetical protein
MDVVKDKVMETGMEMGTMGMNAMVDAAEVTMRVTDRVSHDVNRLARGGQKKLAREAKAEAERQRQKALSFQKNAVTRLRELPQASAAAMVQAGPSGLQAMDTATPNWLKGVGSLVGGAVGGAVGGSFNVVGGVARGVGEASPLPCSDLFDEIGRGAEGSIG